MCTDCDKYSRGNDEKTDCVSDTCKDREFKDSLGVCAKCENYTYPSTDGYSCVFDNCSSEQTLIIDGTCKDKEVQEPVKKSNSTALIVVIVLMAIIILVLIAILFYRKYKNDQNKGQIESESLVKSKKKANLEEMPISNMDIYDDRPESPPLPTQMAKTNDDGLKINLESL